MLSRNPREGGGRLAQTENLLNFVTVVAGLPSLPAALGHGAPAPSTRNGHHKLFHDLSLVSNFVFF